jgi:nitroimidazol reductase NimA-like FMN-containing flavoprotein (pyridoxamine 5'-phosphate oxidase superfamily)
MTKMIKGVEALMRRKEKEIREIDQISKIIKKCQVCRLGLSQDNVPYIVPLSFGYDGAIIYFHTAKNGRKIEILSVNNNVCFEFESGVEVVQDKATPCNWSFSFQSVIGFGTAKELSSHTEKIKGLTEIMSQYSNKKWILENMSLDNLRVWAINIKSMTGKQSLDHAKR